MLKTPFYHPLGLLAKKSYIVKHLCYIRKKWFSYNYIHEEELRTDQNIQSGHFCCQCYFKWEDIYIFLSLSLFVTFFQDIVIGPILKCISKIIQNFF